MCKKVTDGRDYLGELAPVSYTHLHLHHKGKLLEEILRRRAFIEGKNNRVSVVILHPDLLSGILRFPALFPLWGSAFRLRRPVRFLSFLYGSGRGRRSYG